MPSLPDTHDVRRSTIKHNDTRTLSIKRQARRQYRTNSKQRRAIREVQLQRQPLCQDCNDQGKITAGYTKSSSGLSYRAAQ